MCENAIKKFNINGRLYSLVESLKLYVLVTIEGPSYTALQFETKVLRNHMIYNCLKVIKIY